MGIDRRDRVVFPITILSGASLSAEFQTNQMELVGVITPSNIDAATSVTFQAIDAGTTFVNVHDDAGNEVSVVVAASRYTVVGETVKVEGAGRMKLRLGTSGAPVSATADRVIKLVFLS